MVSQYQNRTAEQLELEDAFRRKQLAAEKQRLRHQNAAAISECIEDHPDLLFVSEERAVQVFSFDRDMLTDNEPLVDISRHQATVPVAQDPVFVEPAPPELLGSEVPPSLSKQIAQQVKTHERKRKKLTVRQMERLMAQPLTKPLARKERDRLQSLGPYMGSYVYDTYSTRYTPWDYIHFKEQQHPWRPAKESHALPSPVFFVAKCRNPTPAPGVVENYEDEVEAILQSLADMPEPPPVMTMAELKARRLNRGLPWAHMHRDK